MAKTTLQFTPYEFLAYLMSGFIYWVVDFFVFPNSFQVIVNRIGWDDWLAKAVIVIGGALVCFLTGQFLALGSSLVLEEGLVRSVIGHPVRTLLGESSRHPKIMRFLGGRYYTPLPPEVIKTIKTKAARGLAKTTSIALISIFYVAEEYGRASPDTAQRLEGSRNHYAFMRNTSLALFLDAALLITHHHPQLALICGLGGVFAVIKFMRFYSTYFAQALRSLLQTAPIAFEEEADESVAGDVRPRSPSLVVLNPPRGTADPDEDDTEVAIEA